VVPSAVREVVVGWEFDGMGIKVAKGAHNE